MQPVLPAVYTWAKATANRTVFDREPAGHRVSSIRGGGGI